MALHTMAFENCSLTTCYVKFLPVQYKISPFHNGEQKVINIFLQLSVIKQITFLAKLNLQQQHWKLCWIEINSLITLNLLMKFIKWLQSSYMMNNKRI